MSGKGLPLLSLTPFKQAALFTPVGWRVGEARAARPRLSVDRGPAVGSGQSDSGWCEHMNALTLGGLASAVEPQGRAVGRTGGQPQVRPEEYVVQSVFDGLVARLSPPPFVRFVRFQLAQATNSHREAGVRVSMSRPRFRWSSISAAHPNMRA